MSDKHNNQKALDVLADEIIGMRKQRGWTQEDLAYHSGVPRGSIAAIEAARVAPRPRTLAPIAKALGADHLRWERLLSGKPMDLGKDAIDLAALLDAAPPEVRQLMREFALLPPTRQARLAPAVQAMIDALRPQQP